jgi:hypothetical protein
MEPEKKDPEKKADPKPDEDDKLDFEFDTSLAEAEKEELRELNAKLNTNYESLDELKADLKKTDNNQKAQEVRKEQDFVDYFESVLKYDDKKIVFEDARLKAQQEGLNLNDPDVIDSIKAKIENYESNEILSVVADNIRSKVEFALQGKKKIIEDFNNEQQQTQAQREAERKQKLQQGVESVWKQGKFLGVKPTKENMLKIYQDISRNKHIEHLRANPVDAVKFALFLEHEDTIMKFFDKPGFNDGVKKVLKEMGMDTSASPSTPAVPADDSGMEDLSYLERLAK